MKRRRNFVSVLGASLLAALALSAVFASSAFASGTGLFLVNLELIEPEDLPVPVKGLTTEDGELLSTGLEIYCSNEVGKVSAHFTGNITSKTHGKGSATFLGCIILDGEEVCLIENEGELPSPASLGGTVKSEPLLAEVLLLGKIVKFTPLTGTILAKVPIVSHGGECPVIVDAKLEVINVEGSVCAEWVEKLTGPPVSYHLAYTDLLLILLTNPHCSLSVGGNPAEIHGQPILVTTDTEPLLKVTTHA